MLELSHSSPSAQAHPTAGHKLRYNSSFRYKHESNNSYFSQRHTATKCPPSYASTYSLFLSTLGTKHHNTDITANNAIITGCNDPVLYFCASAPVRNGKIADPILRNPHSQCYDGVSKAVKSVPV